MKKLAKFAVTSLILVGLGLGSLMAISASLTPVPYHSNGHTDGAIIRVYGANVWGIRGYFAIHTWIATKIPGQQDFRIHEVIGWKLRRNKTAVTISTGNPHRRWFGSEPILLHEVTGKQAANLIPSIHQAVRDYPYANTYTMWPGPNSNSFTEWVALRVPELGLSLPAKAIGRSWMFDNYLSENLSWQNPTLDELALAKIH